MAKSPKEASPPLVPLAYLDEVISAAEVQLGENGGSTTPWTCSSAAGTRGRG